MARMGLTAGVKGITGVVLAAGAGSRYGTPKALARTPEGRAWIGCAVDALSFVCADVLVVLGAEADAAARLVPAGARPVVAADWAGGMSRSLKTGLTAAADADAVLVTLVDLPGLPASVCERLVDARIDRGVLRRAAYRGLPGHPVLIGQDHIPALVAGLRGDRGAQAYLEAHGSAEVECGDLFDGRDVDLATEGGAS